MEKKLTNNNKNKINEFFTVSNFLIICFPYVHIVRNLNQKSKDANMRPSFNIWFFIMFCFTTLIIFFGSAAAEDLASQILATNQDSIFANIVAYINPDVLDNTQLNQTYTSKDVGIYLAMIGVFANKAALSLFLVSFVWFSFKSILDLKMGVLNSTTISKATVCFGLFLMLLPTSILKTNVHGVSSEKTMFQYLFDKSLYEVVSQAEEAATTNMNKPVSVPSFKVISPKNLRNDFTKISNVYLLGYENTDKIEDTLSIEYIDNEYRVEFEAGGTRTKITTQSGVAINKQASLFGINLLAKEQVFIKSYFEYMFNNAVKLGKKLENIEFSYLETQTGDLQDFENVKGLRLAFNDDYNTYCENIYDYSLAGSDRETIQRYIEITSICSAQNFLIEHYESPYFNIADIYNKNYILRDNQALMFGINNPTVNYDQIEDLIKNTCNGGYIACAEAIQFASMHNVEGNKRLGILAQPVAIINELAGSVYDASDKVLKVKSFTQEASRTIQFRDVVSDDRALFNIPFQLHHTKNTGLIADSFDLYDFNKLGIPSMEDVMGTISGGDLTLPYERVKTCFYHTNEVFNGFKCNSPSKELTDFGTGLIKLGVAIKFSTAVVSSIPTKSKLKDGAAFGNKIGSKLTSSVAVLSSLVLPSLFTNPTKDDPYYSQNTVQGLVLLNFIISFFNETFSVALDMFSTFLINSGIGIIFLVYGFYFQIFLLFIAVLIELIIDSKVLMLKLYSAIINDGFDGIGAVFKEVVAELTFLIFLVFMMNDMTYIMDIILLSQFDTIFTITETMKGSIESVLIGMPQLFIAITVEVVKLMLIGSFLTGLLHRILASIK